MSSTQPTIKVDHIASTSANDGSSSKHKHKSHGHQKNGGKKREASVSPTNLMSTSDQRTNPANVLPGSTGITLGESSLGAMLGLNLHMRRKSSPCIGENPFADRSRSSVCATTRSPPSRLTGSTRLVKTFAKKIKISYNSYHAESVFELNSSCYFSTVKYSNSN